MARPGADPMAAAAPKMAVAFEFFEKLGVPYYCFHDRDVAPEGATFAEFRDNLDALADDALGYQERTGVQLLWGTANLFSHPRYQGGASTNPDPEVFAYAAAQVKHMLEVTQRLGGTNYVLWGGREGYDTLLNTDLRREGDQLARFLHLVAEHKHRIGFAGHAADRAQADGADQAPVRLRLGDGPRLPGPERARGRVQLNIEANHATLAGHSFHHEVAYAVAHGMLGSIDANRGDPQNGWDTDQFPNSVEDLALPLYEILKGGGFTTGGFNFDAKLRRQSIDRTTCSTPTSAASTRWRGRCSSRPTWSRAGLSRASEERYAGWNGDARAGDPGRGASRSRRSRRGSRRARSTRARVAGSRSCSRTSSTRAIWTADQAGHVESGAGR